MTTETVTIERSKLKLALEALEGLWKDGFEGYPAFLHENAITAIKETLAQPAVPQGHEQEPVAYLVYDHGAESQYLAFDDELGDMDGCEVTSLYTTPPQRTWVGLTDEEIERLAKQARSKDHAITLAMRELKEKNS